MIIERVFLESSTWSEFRYGLREDLGYVALGFLFLLLWVCVQLLPARRYIRPELLP